jgi:hypothetical protein
VVEMDVAEEEMTDVRKREPTRRKGLLERGHSGRRAAVEERRPVALFE